MKSPGAEVDPREGEPRAPGSGAAPAPADPAPAARFLDRVSGALLLGSAIVTAATAGPAVLHAGGVPAPHRGAASDAPPLDLPRRPPEILADPGDALDADHDLDGDEAPFPLGAHGRLGLARRALQLRDAPSESGRTVGEIDAGALVVIVREVGDYAQVRTGGPVGWVKKSEIAVR